MYVYITTGPRNDQYEVGFYTTKYAHDNTPYLAWNGESTHNTIKAASARVNYLNGGTGEPPKRPDPYSDNWRNPYKASPGWLKNDG
jgi:hypothetical protein